MLYIYALVSCPRVWCLGVTDSCLLGIEAASFRRTQSVSALNHCAISPSHRQDI